MSFRNTSAGNLKKGSYFIDDDSNEVCMVLDITHSKSGKHGHAKNRVSCVGLFDKKKRSLVFSSGSMVKVPDIFKKSGQILNITEDAVTLLDLESYEELEAEWPQEEDPGYSKLKEIISDPDSWGNHIAEYWDVMGRKIIKNIKEQ